MQPVIYLAGRSEDRLTIARLRDKLAEHGIRCTSRWLEGWDAAKQHDPAYLRRGATMDLADLARADVLVLVNPAKAHRTGTGGRHVETGVAIGVGKPVVIVGERENVFHYLPIVRQIPARSAIEDVVGVICDVVRGGSDGAR